MEGLRAMAARVADLTPAMQAAAEAVKKGIDDRFRSQTDWEGAPWTPLAASTLLARRGRKSRRSVLRNLRQAAVGREIGSGTEGAWYARAARGTRILQNTGVLRNSISVTAGKKSVTLGTNTPYAGPHQFGTTRLPRRSFLPVVASGSGYTFSSGAPAAAVLTRIRRYIAQYVKTGRLG